MKVNDLFVSKTGEAMRVVKIDGGIIHLSLFESEFVIDGDANKIDGLVKATGMKPIDEDDYKLRVAAMRVYQDLKNGLGYPYKDSYLGQYKEMKGYMTKEATESFFTLGGGFREYEI